MSEVALPAAFHELSFLPRQRAKDSSRRGKLSTWQPKNERTRSRVFPTTSLQSSPLLLSYEKYPLPYCNSGCDILFENKKGCRRGRLLPSTSPAASHICLVKLSGNGYMTTAWI